MLQTTVKIFCSKVGTYIFTKKKKKKILKSIQYQLYKIKISLNQLIGINK